MSERFPGAFSVAYTAVDRDGNRDEDYILPFMRYRPRVVFDHFFRFVPCEIVVLRLNGTQWEYVVTPRIP